MQQVQQGQRDLQDPPEALVLPVPRGVRGQPELRVQPGAREPQVRRVQQELLVLPERQDLREQQEPPGAREPQVRRVAREQQVLPANAVRLARIYLIRPITLFIHIR